MERIKINEIQFPKIVAEVHAYEKIAGRLHEAQHNADEALFRIGDALIDECGRPGLPGENNGSDAKLEQAAQALKESGCRHRSVAWLRKLRTVANAYPPDKRLPGVSWAAHHEAQNSETLRAAQREALLNRAKLSVKFVRRLREKQAAERAAREREKLNGHGKKRDPACDKALQELDRSAVEVETRFIKLKQTIEPYVDQFTEVETKDVCAKLDCTVAAISSVRAMLQQPRQFAEAAE